MLIKKFKVCLHSGPLFVKKKIVNLKLWCEEKKSLTLKINIHAPGQILNHQTLESAGSMHGMLSK